MEVNFELTIKYRKSTKVSSNVASCCFDEIGYSIFSGNQKNIQNCRKAMAQWTQIGKSIETCKYFMEKEILSVFTVIC